MQYAQNTRKSTSISMERNKICKTHARPCLALLLAKNGIPAPQPSRDAATQESTHDRKPRRSLRSLTLHHDPSVSRGWRGSESPRWCCAAHLGLKHNDPAVRVPRSTAGAPVQQREGRCHRHSYKATAAPSLHTICTICISTQAYLLHNIVYTTEDERQPGTIVNRGQLLGSPENSQGPWHC